MQFNIFNPVTDIWHFIIILLNYCEETKIILPTIAIGARILNPESFFTFPILYEKSLPHQCVGKYGRRRNPAVPELN